MAKIARYIYNPVKEILQKKMVFIGGPRQVGKTTLGLSLISAHATEKHPAYFNWDDPRIPPKLKKLELPPNEPLLLIDEIHKYKHWRNLIKGLYDTEKSTRKILVTGSARLDYYRRGGDSLANRYRYIRLHPFSLNELNPNPTMSDLQTLMHFGGFPEPLFSQDEKEWRLWQRDRHTRVVKEDLRDLEAVKEISLVEQLVEILPHKVGSPLSVQSIREDLLVDHKTAERWIQILENLYICYRILPYGSPKIRAVKKEKKLYMWDWSHVSDAGARFENLVASHLLKYCHYHEDFEGYKMELRYIRDSDKREVDFVVLKDSKPLFAVEAKTGEKEISPHIKYFSERTPIPKFYQVHKGVKHYQHGKIEVIPFTEFVKNEP